MVGSLWCADAYLLETLHDYRHEGYTSIVIEASYSSLIGVGNDSGGFQTGGNGSMSEGEIEHPGEGLCQLVRTGFDWDVKSKRLQVQLFKH